MQELSPIEPPYLLCVHIKLYRDGTGERYLDELWYIDLKRHLYYLNHLILACPCEYSEPPEGCIAINNDPALANLRFIELPAANSRGLALIQLPLTILKLWQAISRAEIVHTGIAGWPLAPGWLITPMILLQRKWYYINVESAPWRLSKGIPASPVRKFRSFLAETYNRWCLAQTDLATFTQLEYRNSLLSPDKKGYVVHASWIDEAVILSPAKAQDIWQKKRAFASKSLKIIFVGRLTAEKGVKVLLTALELLNSTGQSIELDILGQGELERECQSLSQKLTGSVQLQMLGTVSYGADFFRILQDYHLLVVPSLSDEQPRIVYDAYSQALPVIASDTAGLQDCVREGETGMLIEPNNPRALQEKILWSGQNIDRLELMGLAGIEVANQMTHQEMHRKRWQLLSELLPDRVF